MKNFGIILSILFFVQLAAAQTTKNWWSEAIVEPDPHKRIAYLVRTAREMLSTDIAEVPIILAKTKEAAEASGDKDGLTACRIIQLAYSHIIQAPEESRLLDELAAELGTMSQDNQFYYFLAKTNIELDNEDFKSAFVSAHRAILTDSTHPMICSAYNSIARVYEFWYDRESAINYYNLALSQTEKGSLEYGIILYNLGDLFTMCNDYVTAEMNIQEALVILTTRGAVQHLNNATFNLARVYSESGRYRLAIETSLRGLYICRSDSLVGEKYLYYTLLINNYLKLNEIEKAKFYGELLKLAASISVTDEAEGAFYLAILSERLGEHSSAIQYIKKAIKLAQSVQAIKLEYEYLNEYFLIAAFVPDDDMPKYSSRLSVLREIIQKKDVALNMSMNAQRIEAEKEVEKLKLDLAKADQATSSFRLLAMGATLAAILIAIISYSIYHSFKKYKQMCVRYSQSMKFYELFRNELKSVTPRVNQIVMSMEFDGTKKVLPEAYNTMKTLQDKLFKIQEQQ